MVQKQLLHRQKKYIIWLLTLYHRGINLQHCSGLYYLKGLNVSKRYCKAQNAAYLGLYMSVLLTGPHLIMIIVTVEDGH